MKNTCILLFLLFFCSFLRAQDSELVCGFDYNSNANILNRSLNNNALKNSVNGYFIINVVFWQVLDDSGNMPSHYSINSKITYKRANELIKGINSKFNPHNICFVLKGIKNVKS